MTQPPPAGPGGRQGAAPSGEAAERAAPLASSGPGQAAAAVVLALSKSARSLTLYDPGNALVRQFLAEFQARVQQATAGGALVLDVHPFELLREGEVVYREEDRERSLAFKLFRDGVRRLTFEPGAPWGELLRFLEIVAVRFAGVRQQEDDVVTLLRKAEFGAISFSAVEGYEPEEDDPEPSEGARRRGQGAEPPAGFDTPFPLLPSPGPLAHRPVPPEALAPLVAEEGPEALAQNALRLATLLLHEVSRGVVSTAEVQLFLAELRDFLVADGALPALAALADLVGRLPPGPLRDEVLRALGDARVLAAVLAAVPPGTARLPPEAARLVPLVPSGAALDLLGEEADEGRRALLVRLVEARLPADAEAVVARLGALDPAVSRALVQALVARAPAWAAAAAGALLEHPDERLQVEALRAVEVAGGEVPVARLVKVLASPREPVRLQVLRLLEQRAERAAFTAVAAALTERKGHSPEEATALGRALARTDPARAAPLFAQWLAVKKGLLGVLGGARADEHLRFAAVAGLGAHPAPEAVAQIEAVAKGAEEALRRHCFATLARRRHEEARRG